MFFSLIPSLGFLYTPTISPYMAHMYTPQFCPYISLHVTPMFFLLNSDVFLLNSQFGLAADVIIMLGGLTEAVESLDVPKAKSLSKKAKASLDDVIAVCKGAGL